MPTAKCEAAIFDLFGTLVDMFSFEKHQRVLARMAEAVAAPPEEFSKIWVETFDQRGTGHFPDIESNIAHICRRLGVEPDENAVAAATGMRMEFSRECLTPRSDAVHTLQQIRASGRKVGLITDCSAEVPMLWPETPFASLVDVPTFSCVAGIRKPDPRIYHMTCERLGVVPDACLYLGDGSSRELTGAAEVGMSAILIRVPYEDSYDVFRPDVDSWDGPVIGSLGEVMACLADG